MLLWALLAYDRELMEVAAHWHRILSKGGPEKSSWYLPQPRMSLQLVKKYARNLRRDSILDVGGGASTMAESLLRVGYAKLTVADWAPACLDWTYRRLGAAAERYKWVCADVLKGDLGGPHVLWHDRACFHFITDAAEQAEYVQAVRRHLVISGHVIVGVYARGGPTRASGLAVLQFSDTALAQAFGPSFDLVETQHERVESAMGRPEPYLYAVFKRRH